MAHSSTQITVPESVLFRDLEGEAVLLDTLTGRYYGLNEVGTRMWSLLLAHREIGATYRDLLGEYQVSPRQLEQDLSDFVQLLASRGLILIPTSQVLFA